MFIAMNKFTIAPGRGEDFESVWKTRESFFHTVPGFVRFSLLRGDTAGDYISHSTWESREAFAGWTTSEAFRKAHGQSPLTGILAGPPVVSLYEAVIEQEAPAAAAAH
jgi:heme-degrading monooxygenase HmoA